MGTHRWWCRRPTSRSWGSPSTSPPPGTWGFHITPRHKVTEREGPLLPSILLRVNRGLPAVFLAARGPILTQRDATAGYQRRSQGAPPSLWIREQGGPAQLRPEGKPAVFPYPPLRSGIPPCPALEDGIIQGLCRGIRGLPSASRPPPAPSPPGASPHPSPLTAAPDDRKR